MKKTIWALGIGALLLAVALATTASAGNSSITLNPQRTASALGVGSQVTFSISQNRTAQPWVSVECYQSRVLVYKQYHGMFAGYYTDAVFTLGPTPSWTSGGASCVGTLLYFSNGREHSLATTSFSVP